MAYTISDIAGLAEYHLVASAPDDDTAHANLVQLVQQLELMAPRPLWREATWVFDGTSLSVRFCSAATHTRATRLYSELLCSN